MLTAYCSRTNHPTEYAKGLASFLLGFAVLICALYCDDARAQAVLPATPYRVGMTQVEFSDPAAGGRSLNFMLIYPAAPERTAKPFKIFLSTNLHLYKDAPPVDDIIVGAGDTTTPPKENAEFAAKYIPQVRLDVLPGPIHHEIFGNECDQIGRDNYPEACVDAAGVNRAELHEYIGTAALRFFDSHLKVRRQKAP